MKVKVDLLKYFSTLFSFAIALNAGWRMWTTICSPPGDVTEKRMRSWSISPRKSPDGWVRKVTVVPGLRPPELQKIFARADDVAGITG